MCLDSLTQAEAIKIGYKVFKYDPEQKTLMPSIRGNRVLLVGEWLNEICYRPYYANEIIQTKLGEEYKTGWHVFHEDARYRCMLDYSEQVWEVECDDLQATGYEGDYLVSVFKYIRIIKQIK